MSNNQSSFACILGGWGLAIIAGILAAVLLMLLGDWRLIQAIFAALVVTVIVGALLMWIVCKPLPEQGAIPASRASTNPVPSNEQSAAQAAAAAREGAEPAPVSAPAVAAAAAKSGVVPSAKLAGEEELASRKGTWKYEANADDAAAEKAKADADAKAEAAAKKAAAAAAKVEAEEKAKADAEAKAAAAASSDDKDYDGDGVVEGTEEGSKPAALEGPRDGKADNLKEIKGIGPKLEKLCNSMGFYHFDQIAAWSADEIAWVNANLEGFKGRVSRDNWVEQAKILAAGGETEFSKRVDDGDVY